MHLTLNKRRLLIVGLASLGLAIGCSLPGRLLQQASEEVLPPPPEALATPEREAQETPPQGVPGGSAGPDLGGLVGWGDVELVDVTANGEISGPGIGVVVRNPGPEEITVVIPCGFTFLPGDSSDQRLMVVQEASATIPAGGEETLTAFVICIDPTSSAPDDGETYSMGAMESGDLLRLAQCVCRDNLEANPMGGLEVMLAGWSLRGESLAAAIGEDTEGAAGDLFGEGTEELLGGFLGSLSTMGGGLLERCGIEAPATATP